MASQYITFMIIFTLGLSLVIITNGMFSTLSDQFRENVAQVELDTILDQIQLQIQQNLLIHPENNQSIYQRFEFPPALGQGFRYTLDITNSTDGKDIILTGSTFNAEVTQQIRFSVGSVYFVTASGHFISTNPIMTLNLHKNSNIINIQMA
ncbi:hypothetical protein CEE45_06780 [Candidatus Heimdallarchaeota archaeon B3_Heim]|nr:MAG: hypothetical protein CEE45_06780 [Candidatus Heimdallarchaeota archaeon B3_Heim]